MGNKSTKTDHKDLSRFSSLRKSKSPRRKSLVPRSHLPVSTWLKHLGLSYHEDKFKKFQGVEELLYFDEDKIKQLGIVDTSEISCIGDSLSKLRYKYEKNQKLKLDLNPRTSLIEGEEKGIIQLQLEESKVLLREGWRCCRRTPEKRGGALISPDTIVKMSFQGVSHPTIDEAEQKKLLEWELSLDSSDLRSHAWYHGSIPRKHAEELVTENGQFLIRDCISQPGDYVLTCFDKGQVLHFVIQKTISQPNTIYEHLQYQLEGESFETIPDLITSYVGSKRPLTDSSGARIMSPMNRTASLSFYVSRYVAEVEETKVNGTLTRPKQSAIEPKTSSPIRRPSAKVRRPSSEINPDGKTTSSTLSRSIQSNIQFSSHSLPRNISELSLPTAAPPKPSRQPSQKKPVTQDKQIYEEIDDVTPTEECPDIKDYHQLGSDSGNGSGDSVQTSDRKSHGSRASYEDSGYSGFLETDIPDIDSPSLYDLENFHTLLLPPLENRPLDATAFRGVRNTLLQCGSRILATHLTRVDLDVLNGSRQLTLGVTSGIELITLPQGSQLRKDLIERAECMKLFVAVTIVKEEDMESRAEMIHRWIQIAIDTKTATGNLYGFHAIMLGLCMPEVLRLNGTWRVVRQKYTDSAFSFESKLRSTMKSMNECTFSQAPNTLIPHILPFILLCERDLEDIYSVHTKESSLLQWESSGSDHGLEMLISHLREGRLFASNIPLYKRNIDYIMSDTGHLEELTLDMFRTEFHLKFLFGSRAALVDSVDRVPMFLKVISTLSERCESF